jgi:DNA-binding CsgD family transcriptional regulator
MPTVLNLGGWMPVADASDVRLAWEDTGALFRSLTAAQGRAYALDNLGSLARAAGAPQRAELLFRESLASFQRIGDDHGVAQVLAHLGSLAVRLADGARARRFLDDSLALRRVLGDARGVGLALLSLARLDVNEGNLRRGHRRYAETLQHFRDMGDAPGTCYVLEDLADLAIQSGDRQQAESLLSESLAVHQQLGDEWSVSQDGAVGRGFTLQTYAALRTCLVAPPTSADAFLRELLDLQRRWHTPNGLAVLFEDLASAAADQQDYARAARLFGQAAARGSRRYITARDIAQERWPETDPAALATEWERGGILSSECALAYALAASPTASTPTLLRPRLRRTTNGLTEREQDVLRLVVQGLTNRAIASRLVLSERTVAKHLDNVFRKTGVTSRAAATAFALRSGIC